jgi:hypothetical protein
MRLTRQSEDTRYTKFRENVRWTYGDVMFVTLHVIGSNNNLGRTPEMDAEYAERNAANLAWLRQAFDVAKRNGSKAIMIIAQANPRFENTWPSYVQQRYMLAGLGFKSPVASTNSWACWRRKLWRMASRWSTCMETLTSSASTNLCSAPQAAAPLKTSPG